MGVAVNMEFELVWGLRAYMICLRLHTRRLACVVYSHRRSLEQLLSNPSKCKAPVEAPYPGGCLVVVHERVMGRRAVATTRSLRS